MRRKTLATLVLSLAVSSPALAEETPRADPKPYPDVAFKRIGVPKSGDKKINVQIREGEGVRAAEPAPQNAPSAPAAPAAPSGYEWYWAQVPYSIESDASRLTKALTGRGFSAPRILAADLPAGLLLLEDLGDDLFAHAIPRGADEAELYAQGVDTLAAIYRSSFPAEMRAHGGQWTVMDYDAPALLAETELLLDWFVGQHRIHGITGLFHHNAKVELANLGIEAACLNL